MITAISVLLSALFIAGDERSARDTPETRADSVREAVLREYVEADEMRRASRGLRDRQTFYLTVEQRDPSDSLLKRLRKGKSRVRPASEEKSKGVRRDLSLGPVEWETPDRARVWLEATEGLSGTHQKLVVELKDGTWTVVANEGGAIIS